MSIRMIASLVLALVFGIVAVLLVRGYVAGAQKSNTASKGDTPVVVAALPIAHGAAVQAPMLKVVLYPKDIVPAGSFQTVDQVVSGGHVMLRPLTANEPVLSSALSGSGAKSHLSAVLDPGMRAITFRASDVSGVGGFALPGDRVDVLGTRAIGSGEQAFTVTQALAEAALVLGVDQSSDQNADTPVVSKAITLEVTPEQAQSISLAQSIGSVALSLRQTGDTTPLARKATTVTDLGRFGAPAPAAAGPAMGVAPAGPPRLRLPPGGVEVHVTRGIDSSNYGVTRF